MPELTKNAAPTQSIQAGQQYMPALTGIRAIAAYMVCIFHYNPLKNFREASGWKHFAFSFINELHVGVTIFFVLSGFLICYRYYGTAVHITRKWFARYLMNRVARIYPMYLLITLLTFALTEINPARYELIPYKLSHPLTERIWVFILNLTMLKAFFNDYRFTGIAQAWSLTVEECFYLSAPFFMIGIRRSRWAWVVLPVGTLLFMVGLWQTIGQLDFHGLFGTLQFMLNFTFFGRCLEFFAGIALAVYVRQQQHLSNALSRRGPWFTLLGTGFAFICVLAMAAISGPDNSKDTYAGIAINNVLLPIGVTLLFYGLLVEKSWLRSLLSTKLFDILGKSSYIFYLIHMGVTNILLKTYFVHSTVLQFIALNIISILLYKFVESPIHSWLRPKSPVVNKA